MEINCRDTWLIAIKVSKMKYLTSLMQKKSNIIQLRVYRDEKIVGN